MSNLGQRSDLEEAARGQLGALFEAALGAVDPTRCVGPHLPIVMPRGRIVVAGAGKAAAAMAHGVEVEARATGWFERLEGMVITRYGHGVTCERITVAEAAHPVPDEAGL
ncbi:MAG: hypothetical protein CL573_04220, partial [Alphaproteobacteria bacterium]|nr:hypothetical protein [Alphaproteobacteria bacterium]